MPRNPKLTNADALTLLAERLRTQASAPNIFAYEPHDKQRVFHCSTCKKKLYIGGNRSGKTTGGIVEDIWWLTGTHPFRETPAGPIRGRVVSVDFVNGIEKIILPQFKQWLPTSLLINGSWEDSYDKLLRTLTLANGSFVEFMSYDQDLDKFAGTSRHFIHFDEEPPQDIYTECLARLVDTNGSFWITMTPVEGMTWVYDTLYEPGVVGEKGILVIEVSMSDNPHLDAEAIKDFLDSLDEDERKAREHGQFVQLGGLIYKHFKPEVHVVKEGWRPPKDWLVAASLDHGYNNPTAWLWHAVSPDGEVVTFHEHYASGSTVDVHAAEVRKFNADPHGLNGREPDYYIGDPSIRNTDPITGTSIHQEYIRYGIPIVLGNNDVKAGINRVSRYLKLRPNGRPNWVITENCKNLIKELRRYRWATYASKKIANANNLKDEPHKKDDHACDSARYFFMSRPDLAPTADSVNTTRNPLGVVEVSASEPRAEVNRRPSAPQTEYHSSDDLAGVGSSSQWTYDELGGMW